MWQVHYVCLHLQATSPHNGNHAHARNTMGGSDEPEQLSYGNAVSFLRVAPVLSVKWEALRRHPRHAYLPRVPIGPSIARLRLVYRMSSMKIDPVIFGRHAVHVGCLLQPSRRGFCKSVISVISLICGLWTECGSCKKGKRHYFRPVCSSTKSKTILTREMVRFSPSALFLSLRLTNT